MVVIILIQILIINVVIVGGIVQKNGIMNGVEFGKKCEEWAKDNILDEDGRKFILKNRFIPDLHLFNLLARYL